MKHRRHSPGFTLAEMLVAVAIFTALMAGLAMLFTGTLRAVRQGYQQMEAFENARAALTALKNDLTISSGSEQHADYYSFYGTPVGMTFVGVARTSDDDPADLNIARITYVVYDMWKDWQRGVDGSAYKEFPEALEDYNDDGVFVPQNAYVYVLLRYVEPGVSDLESFPVFRDELLKDDLEEVIEAAVADLADKSDAYIEGFRKAKRRELWILMLSGGGLMRVSEHDYREVPNAWDAGVLENPNPYDYVVMEHVLSIAHPKARYEDPADELYRAWDQGTTFFDYDYAEDYYAMCEEPPEGCPEGEQWDPQRCECVCEPEQPCPEGYTWDVDECDCVVCNGEPPGGCPEGLYWHDRLCECRTVGEAKKKDNIWWNDYRSRNCRPEGASYCRDPRLPEVVLATFWMMYDSPYPGAPEFKRRFSIEIFLPVGYAREKG